MLLLVGIEFEMLFGIEFEMLLSVNLEHFFDVKFSYELNDETMASQASYLKQ